jgi:type IV pilus assembly protein PilB
MKGLHQQFSVLAALLKHYLITQEMVDTINVQFAQQSKPFIRFLIEDKKLDADLVAAILAKSFGYPLIDLHAFDVSLIPEGIRNEKLIRQHDALPLFLRGKVLFVAMSDPTNLDALEEIQFNTGYTTELILANEKTLHECIERVFEHEDTSLDISDIDTEELSGIDVQDEKVDDNAAVTGDKEDAPIVVYINKILLDAIRKGASDLHFEPYEKSYRIRFRVDGILAEIAKPPISLAARMAARLKVMSKLDIAERRVPQDGRIKLALSKKKSIDFRVSTLPTMWGEKIVMRILDSSSAMLGIDMLGYDIEQKKNILRCFSSPTRDDFSHRSNGLR